MDKVFWFGCGCGGLAADCLIILTACGVDIYYLLDKLWYNYKLVECLIC